MAKAIQKRNNTAVAAPVGRIAQQIARQKADFQSGLENNVKITNGKFYLGEEDLGDTLEVVILDYTFEKRWFEHTYDPDNPSSPECFAIGYEEGELRPHENSLKPQSEDCHNCEFAQWGSGSGKGKACQDRIRLALIPDDEATIQKIGDSEVFGMNLPSTSIKNFTKYGSMLGDAETPFPYVVTEMTLEPAGTYSIVHFDIKRSLKITKPLGEALNEKVEGTEQSLMAPYQRAEEVEAPKPKAKRKAPSKKSKLRK